jgi:phenylalanyl-tRNA synthetase beta chain
MLFSYNWLQSFFKDKLPAPKKLAQLLTLHSFEVEDVKKVGKPACRSGRDWVFDIDVTPNRAADCFSHLGISRECSAFTKLKIKSVPRREPKVLLRGSKLKVKEDNKNNIKDFVQVEIKNAKDCPRYTGRVITGVKVKASPKYIQERLKSCGLDPINNIVDAANYVMLELGQPLHAFDFDKIALPVSKETKRIIIRRAKIGEKIEALDDKIYKLDEDILVIADSEKPLAIAGIKGGKSTAIDKKTKNVFLESANFNPILIRKTSKKLGLKTDASFRFEHGMDPNMTETAIDQLAELVQKTAGGRIAKDRADIYAEKVLSRKIKLNLAQVEDLLGVKISKNEVIKILKSLGFGIDSKFQVKVPTWRPDITQSEDLTEEIGRIYGYEKLKSVFPIMALIPSQRNDELVWQERAKNILKAAGFFEVYNYSFISKRTGDYLDKGLVELENPFSEQFYYLRPNLLINLLDNIRHNSKYLQKKKELKIFELGKVFKKRGKGIEEKKMLAGMLTRSKEDFYILKGVLDGLLQGLGISDKFYDDYQASRQIFWNPKKSAEIKISGQEVGFLGELSSKVLSKLGVKESVTAFEIDFDKLVKLCSEEQQYQAVSKFPSAVRDIAVLVPLQVKMADVLNKINIAGGELIQDVDLFDIYEGQELPEGKKNFAFHIIFQAKDRTLNGKEIENVFKKIIKALEKELDWEIRR